MSSSTHGSGTRDGAGACGGSRLRRRRQAPLSRVHRAAAVRPVLGRVHPPTSARDSRCGAHHPDGRHRDVRGPHRAVRPDRVPLQRSPPGAVTAASLGDRSLRTRCVHTDRLRLAHRSPRRLHRLIRGLHARSRARRRRRVSRRPRRPAHPAPHGRPAELPAYRHRDRSGRGTRDRRGQDRQRHRGSHRT